MREDKWLYLECYSGISGDMTVGALLDLGASREVLEKTLGSMGIGGYHLHFGRTLKCGIDAFDFDVHLEDGDEHGGHEHEGHGPGGHEHGEHEHGKHGHGGHEHSGHDHEGREHGMHSHDGAQHVHEVHRPGGCGEHCHVHPHHSHVHRNIGDIFAIIDRLEAQDPVKALAKKMFTIVAEAESKAHGIPKDEVHFHEVGAVDSIVDIISVAVCLHDLGITRVAISSLAEGRGYVRCQHGVMPVPVPATANIAAAHSLELKLTDNEGEMVTPTGAAIAAALKTEDGLPEHYVIERVGIGAGNKDFKNANILRAMIIRPATKASEQAAQLLNQPSDSSLWMLECNLDDCTGEALGFALGCLLEEGARDVWYTPAYMKKNRPAYVLHMLCDQERIHELESAVFAQTTTIGIRRFPVDRTVMERKVETVQTPLGPAQVKWCQRGGDSFCYPEYESVKAICWEHKLGFHEVYHQIKEAAIQDR